MLSLYANSGTFLLVMVRDTTPFESTLTITLVSISSLIEYVVPLTVNSLVSALSVLLL